MTLWKDEVIEGRVLNHGRAAAKARFLIYQNKEIGKLSVEAQCLYDSGWFDVRPSHCDSLFWSPEDEMSHYWVRIETSSRYLVPTILFAGTVEGGEVPIVDYRPGDFAIFQSKAARDPIRYAPTTVSELAARRPSLDSTRRPAATAARRRPRAAASRIRS